MGFVGIARVLDAVQTINHRVSLINEETIMDDRHRRDKCSQARSHERPSLVRFKNDLARIFFTSDSPIAKFSEDYDNFWKFLPRYEQRMATSRNGEHKLFFNELRN